MAEIATIARPYAEALFKAHGAEAASTSDWLDALAALASNEELRQFANNPKASVDQVIGVMTGALKTSLPTIALNFLRLVVENRRLAALPEIAQQFRNLKNASQGTSDAVVYSAFDIDAAALSGLSGILEKRFGRKLNLHVQLQPDLIGGVRVVVGDEVLDTSVKARLEQMKVALTA